jgi:hypothetical protein
MDVGQVAAEVVPYVTAAVQAYGIHTLDKVKDAAVEEASDATVGLGRRLLKRLFGRDESRQVIEGAVVDVAAAPDDADTVAALRLQIRKALAADPALAAEIAGMLPAQSVHIEASGTRSVAVHTNPGIINTGDDATFHK